MERRKSYIPILLLSVALSLSLQSCTQWKGFEIKSVSVRTLSPHGLKSADLTVSVTVMNPGKSIQVDSILGEIKVADSPMFLLRAEDFVLEQNSEKEYLLPVQGYVTEGLNVFYVLGALTDGSPESIKMDVRAYVRVSGTNFGRTIEYKDIPLASLVGI